MTPGTAVRPPAVAGTFYPADPHELATLVDADLDAVAPTGGVPPKALIVPHAGYVYSGPVAASAYARLRAARGVVQRVVLLGPAHRVAVASMAVPTTAGFATPLGVVAVDDDARQRALALPGVVADDRPHRPEHSLEVHLPFLQRTLGPTGWSVLPVVVGGARPEEVAALLDALWGGPETLIVVSTDLSHYHDHRTAQRLDRATVEAIVADRLEAVGPEDACGAHPLRGLLHTCRRRGLHPELVDLRTSADTAGDADRVVGYAALVVDESRPAPAGTAEPGPAVDAAGLTAADRRALLAMARAALDHRLRTGRRLRIDPTASSEGLRRPGAAFVTLRDQQGALRGCIGSLHAEDPLVVDVADNAVKAALADPRFPPVTPAELDRLTVELSVLSPLAPLTATSWDDLRRQLRPGVDGLVIAAGRHRATFLPAVWEQLPDPDEFLDHLWRKAGLRPRTWPAGMAVQRYETVSVR